MKDFFVLLVKLSSFYSKIFHRELGYLGTGEKDKYKIVLNCKFKMQFIF